MRGKQIQAQPEKTIIRFFLPGFLNLDQSIDGRVPFDLEQAQTQIDPQQKDQVPNKMKRGWKTGEGFRAPRESTVLFLLLAPNSSPETIR